jgi:hypothetical protein
MPISLEQVGLLLSAERIMTYRRMNKGVPILADFKEMVEQGVLIGGKYLNLVVDQGVVRAKLNIPYASYLLFDSLRSAVNNDAVGIRRAQDEFMLAKGDKARWWKQGVELLENPIDSVAIPLPFRNLGSPNASGYDSSVDVGIFRIKDEELELIVIERPELVACRGEIGTNYSLIGGMTLERAARVPQVVLELLEEGISNSIIESRFYLDAMDDVVAYYTPKLPADSTKDNASQRFVRELLLRDTPEQTFKEKCIADLDKLSVEKTVEGKQAKAHYALAMLSFVDEYKKSQNPAYETLMNIITKHVEAVVDSDGHELRLFNRADNRMTSQALNQTAMHTLLIGDSLATVLLERGLSFTGGDDAAHVTHVCVGEFLSQGWGGHPELIIRTADILQARQTLSSDQLAITKKLIPAVMDYASSKIFLDQMENFAHMLLDEIDDVNKMLDKLDGVARLRPSFFSKPNKKRPLDQTSLERLKDIIDGRDSCKLGLKILEVSFPAALHPGMTACEALSMMIDNCADIQSNLDQKPQVVISIL